MAKIRGRSKNWHLDFWHKIGRKIADKHGLMALAHLDLTFIIQNRRLAQSAHDTGLNLFAELLSYKAEEPGKKIVFMDMSNAPQESSGCGVVDKKSPSFRTHGCSSCGLIIDHDVNSARHVFD